MKNLKKWMLRLLIAVLCVVFVVSAGQVVSILYHNAHEKAAFTELQEQVQQEEAQQPVFTPQQVDETPAEPVMIAAYKTLYEQNSDVAGWVTVPNTPINYPVMYTPDEPERYLYRAFDGSKSNSGTPFADAGSALTDTVVLLHGHNMRNDTMFGALDLYKKEAFWKENPTFTCNTLYEKREYEVVAAVETRILYQDEDGFRYYRTIGNVTDEQYGELVQWMKANSLYDTGITPETGDQLVILSTCSYHTKNGRFIVIGRRI